MYVWFRDFVSTGGFTAVETLLPALCSHTPSHFHCSPVCLQLALAQVNRQLHGRISGSDRHKDLMTLKRLLGIDKLHTLLVEPKGKDSVSARTLRIKLPLVTVCMCVQLYSKPA